MMNNFSGCMSIGYAAGLNAAQKAAQTDRPAFPRAKADRLRDAMFAPMRNNAEPALRYTEFEDGLRHVMDYYVGYLRSERSMEKALKSFAVLDEYRDRLKAESPRELMRVTESLELLEFCRIYVQACMQRRETGRAMYIRADYPDLDERYNKMLLARLDESGKPLFCWN